MIGCGGSEAPPKATTTPQVVVPVAVAPPVVPPIEPKNDPVIQPLPPVVVDVAPTLPSKKPTPDPVIPAVPMPKDPEQGPAKTGKDPKDLKDPVKAPKFVVPAAVFGRSFDAWRADIKSKDPAHREKAMKMVLNFGPDKAYEALPDILAELAKHLKPAPIDMSVRVNGIFAISAILSAKKDPEKKVVDDALAVFKTSLRDKQVILRTRAAQGVNRLGPRSQELIDDILSVAHDPTTGEARKEGIMALTLIAVDEKKKVHPKVPVELGKALDDVSGQVKLAALQGLVAIGPALSDKEKQTAVDKINAFLKKKDVDPFLQMTAHVGIMTITGKVEKVHLDPLRKILQDNDDMHRVQALQFIKMLLSKGQDILDDVLVLATDAPTWQMRKEALATAMLLSHDKKGLHPAILPALRNALKDKAPEIRHAAMTGLVAAKDLSEKSEIKTSVASLNALLKTETDPMLEIGAHATIITLTGEITQTHMAPIVDMIKHKDVPVRLEAFRTISLGGKKAKPFALSAVVEAIRDPNITVSVAAIDTLPSLHAFETMDLLKMISADKKSDPAVVEAANDAFILLEEIQTLEKAAKDNGKNKSEKK